MSENRAARSTTPSLLSNRKATSRLAGSPLAAKARLISPARPATSRRSEISAAGAAHDSPRRSSRMKTWPSRMRSEEHTYELQSLMRNSYADFCLKKKQEHQILTEYNTQPRTQTHHDH